MDEKQRWDGIHEKCERYWMKTRDKMEMKRRGERYWIRTEMGWN